MAGVLLSPERASQAVDPRISPAHLALHVGRRPDGTSNWQLYQWLATLNRELMKLARYRLTGQVGPNSIRFLAVEAPVRHGKETREDEPILTAEGWSTAGKLTPGDRVFGPDGQPTTVLAVGPVARSAPKMRVMFSDGASIDVHPNHEWTVYSRSAKDWRTYETAHLARLRLRTGGRYNYQLPERQALRCPPSVLPVAPYLFGVWLGNGQTREGVVDLNPADAEQQIGFVLADGEAEPWRWTHPETKVPRFRFYGLTGRLRAAGVLGDKHIPDAYLLASIDQRRALLQGLVDTDGHVERGSGRVRYVSHNQQLAEDVKLLARSLGHRATVYEEVDTREPHEMAYGAGTRSIATAGVRHVASWTPHDGHPQGRLKRKQAARFRVADRVGIVSIEEAPPADGVCIQVDREDGLYLVGRDLIPTHNSELGTIHFPAWWLGTFPDDPILLGGYNTRFVERFSRRIRNIVRFYGPDVFDIGLSKESSAVDSWNLELPHMGQLVVSSPQAAPTGIGGKLMVIDDPIRSVKEAYSETYRDWVWQWWQFDMRSRLEPGGVVLIIMSRWHEDDIIGRLRARQAEAVTQGKRFSDQMTPEELETTPPEEVIDRFHFLRLPALADPGPQPQEITDEEWAETLRQWRDELGRRPGDALCPQRFNKPALLEMRDSPTGIGPIAFAALMQANPTPAKGLIFDVDGAGGGVGFRFEDEVPLWKMRWVRRWDLAATEKKTGDWTAGVLMGRSEETGMTYIVDVRRVQLGPADVENYMAATANWDGALLGQKVRQHWPQDPGAAGKASANYLSRSDGLADQDTDYTPETGDKVARAMPLAGQVKAGNVVLIRGAWNHDFIEECRAFNLGAHDDQVDAASNGYNDLAGLNRGKVRLIL